MGLRALEIYQGGDWFTYRWSVAQAFDTLDRVNDMCLSHPWEHEHAPDADGIISGISDLCDDLAAELASVEADLQPFLQNSTALRWQAFEMRLYLGEIRQLMSKAAQLEQSCLFDQLLLLTGHIKESLKQLDQ
jgi:hypothetical protein